MTEIELIDNKGDFWRLRFGACQLHKHTGTWCALWYVDEDCPAFLRTNGARYSFIPTPIFTTWWTVH